MVKDAGFNEVKRLMSIETNECVEWQGCLDKDGYGKTTYNYKHWRTHRLSLQLKLGRPLLSSEQALHTCDNPPCVNPRHLYAGSHRDNVLDCTSKLRRRGKRKLSLEDIEYIITSEVGARDLAAIYNVTPTTIWHYRKEARS